MLTTCSVQVHLALLHTPCPPVYKGIWHCCLHLALQCTSISCIVLIPCTRIDVQYPYRCTFHICTDAPSCTSVQMRLLHCSVCFIDASAALLHLLHRYVCCTAASAVCTALLRLLHRCVCCAVASAVLLRLLYCCACCTDAFAAQLRLLHCCVCCTVASAALLRLQLHNSAVVFS